MNRAQLAASLTIPEQVPCTQEPDLWYADDGTDALAKCLCHACPVRAACAEWGADEEFGVWGGLSPRDRRGSGGRYVDWRRGLSAWEVAQSMNDLSRAECEAKYGAVGTTLAHFLRRSGFEYAKARTDQKRFQKGRWVMSNRLASLPLVREDAYTTKGVA